jgi:hypothetical protein
MTINLRADAPSQSDRIDPSELSGEIEKLKTVQTQIKAKEDEIKTLKDQEKNFSNVVIPKLMEDLNIKTMKLSDGSEVSVKEIYSATIKADKKAEAHKWLRDNGLGDIVKNKIIVTFGQNEDDKAMAYATLARGQGYEPTQEEKVHPASLKVVLEEWKKSGKDVPSDLFWTFEGNQTKIKGKKEK